MTDMTGSSGDEVGNMKDMTDISGFILKENMTHRIDSSNSHGEEAGGEASRQERHRHPDHTAT